MYRFLNKFNLKKIKNKFWLTYRHFMTTAQENKFFNNDYFTPNLPVYIE